MVTLRARLHHRLGGLICELRGGHQLSLADHHQLVELNHVRIRRRPFCSTCWKLPGD